MNSKWFLFLFLFLCNCTFAQTNPDSVIAERFFRTAVKNPIDSTMVEAALYFRETPYVAGTLERTDEEELVVNLHELDCMTLVENCLALSRTMQLPSPNYNSFEQELRQIRYRKGFINGYTSRLHYTTDWIFDNVEKEII